MATTGATLDVAYVRTALVETVGDDDYRVMKWDALTKPSVPERRILRQNWCASVESMSALVDSWPPEITSATVSKYPVPTSR